MQSGYVSSSERKLPKRSVPGDNRDRYGNQDRRNDSERYGQSDRYRGGSPSDQAIQACQDRIRGQAAERMNIRDMRFRNADVQDNPGGRDMVRGMFEVRRDYGVDRYRYSCSMRLESGRIFSADIEPVR